MPCCAAVGLIAGKAFTLGISNPSVLEGVAAFVASMSNCASGEVVLMPICAWLSINKSKRANLKSVFMVPNFEQNCTYNQRETGILYERH